MKSLALGSLLCAVLLLGAPDTARAFETEGTGDPLDAASLLAVPNAFSQDFKAHSLAMPLSGKSDGGGAFVSSYGNSIPIPAPGIDLPAPAWIVTPGAITLH